MLDKFRVLCYNGHMNNEQVIYDGTQDLFVLVDEDNVLLVAGQKFRKLNKLYKQCGQPPETIIPLPDQIRPITVDEGGDPFVYQGTPINKEVWVLEIFWWDDLKSIVRGWRRIE